MNACTTVYFSVLYVLLLYRVVCEKSHLRHSRLRGGGAVVELLLGAVLAHDVAQLQRLAHVVQHRQHLSED